MSRIRLLSTLAVMGAMRDLAARYEAETGVSIDADFAPTIALVDRLRGNESADVAILTAASIDDLVRQGLMHAGTRADIALSFVGIAVKTGALKPDLRSVAALRDTLLSARSVVYSKIGASGIFFASLIDRLGIADQVNSRAIIVPSGFTAERVASGEAELAVQQISELMVIPGIEVVGPLPPEIQAVSTFSGGLLVASKQAQAGRALLDFLTSPAIAAILRRSGLEPAATS